MLINFSFSNIILQTPVLAPWASNNSR